MYVKYVNIYVSQGTSVPAWLLRQLMLIFDHSATYAAVAAFFLVSPQSFRTQEVRQHL